MTTNITSVPNMKEQITSATSEQIEEFREHIKDDPKLIKELDDAIDEKKPIIHANGYPFWDPKQLNASRLTLFLEENGFGNFRNETGRTSKSILFKNENGVLEVHDPSSIRTWLINYVNKYEEQSSPLFDKLVRLTPQTLGTWLQSLKCWSSNDFPDTEKLNLFSDDKDHCYITFNNGVVHITSENIKLLEKDALKDKGCIWESSIIPKTIEVTNEHEERNPFKDFIHYALKDNVEPIHPSNGENDYNEGTDDPSFSGRKDAFETAFGYLIHSYQPPSESKVVVFIDVDSSPDRTEGGNGKSVAMKMVSHYRKEGFVDGQGFRKGSCMGSRFNFSSVKVDTGFININDLKKDFDLTQIFSMITDDLILEGKGKDKIVIPSDKKPKMGVSTNHVVTGIGTSFDRRQHIVEFGNFWSRCVPLNIRTESIIGKLLGTDFDDQDWIEFYNYGFYCIQKYLKNGLMEQPNKNYKRKTLVASIEGVDGTGEVTDWIEGYCLEGRKEHPNGVTENDLYSEFWKTVPPNVGDGWTKERLITAMFDYVKTDPSIEWNKKNAHKGQTRSNRRDRRGSRGEQKEYVTITDRS